MGIFSGRVGLKLRADGAPGPIYAPTEETLTTVKEHKRKPKRTADELTQGLPVKEVLLEIPEDEQFCEACRHKLKAIGKKFVRKELEVIPRQVDVIEYYTATYACEECEKESG